PKRLERRSKCEWRTTASAFQRPSGRACSSRSSPPKKSAKAPARALRSPTRSWSTSTAGRSASKPKSAGARPSSSACRFRTEASMRVLFVDDEVRVLEAIERVLFQLEIDWDTSYVGSGEAALAELARTPYDVLISDLRMSGTDGVGLLTRVAELYPRVVRIVLSGHSDEEAALKVVHVAHQFLAKPCPAETLHQVIARIEALTQLLPDRKLQTLAAQISTLPSPARFHQELLALNQGDDAGGAAAAMARLIKQDPGMTSKLLQVASSAFFNSSADRKSTRL